MAVTGHDIRMKEFRRAYLRGYAADDVDTFLMYLAVEMDRRERYYRSLTLDDVLPGAVDAVSPALDDELFVEAPEGASDDDAPATADQPTDATTGEAREQADAIIADAKFRAERGIERAKDHAREIVAAARQAQADAERAEADASLRLAHLEQRVAERAAALAAEARRLDEIAASLAEHDLAPALDEYHTPAHAAPGRVADIVPLARTADD
ncbi:MAG: DivIVA domain-containing protein [Actinomycetota bacterium]